MCRCTTFGHLPPHLCSAVNRTAGGVSCKSQESELAVLWTLGIFALNFGPVLVGPVLDGLGPKWTAVLGEPSPPAPYFLWGPRKR